jgi:hypothetical protein
MNAPQIAHVSAVTAKPDDWAGIYYSSLMYA